MWRILRSFLLIAITVGFGLFTGALIRFAFGRGLQWESPAGKAMPRGAHQGFSTVQRTTPFPGGPVAGDNTLKFLHAIARQDFDSLARLLGEALDLEMEGSHDPNYALLIRRMLECDPIRTIAWVEKNIFGSAALHFIYREWRKLDPDAADAWARKSAPALISRPEESAPEFSDEELSSLISEDPGRVEALLAKHGVLQPSLLRQVAKVRARQDPASAFAWAKSLQSAGDRSTALERTFEEWVKKDPSAAAAAWKSLPKCQAALTAFPAIVAAMSPPDAIKWLRTLEPAMIVRQALAERLPDGAERESLMASLPTPNPAETARGDLNRALQSGPTPESLAALERASRSGARADENIATQFYGKDPAGTLPALQNLPDGRFKTEAADHIGQYLARLPESQAMQQFAALPPGPFRDVAAEQLTIGLTKASPSEALDFLTQQSAEVRAKALPEVMTRWLAQDPARARAAWDALPGADRRGASVELAEKIARNPNAETMTLFATLPDVPAGAAKVAAAAWVSHSPEQASAWIDSLAPGALRDAAVGGMAEALVMREGDPERAFVWAGTIGDAQHRLTSLRTTLELWSLRDPAAAQSARQSLSAADQQALATP